MMTKNIVPLLALAFVLLSCGNEGNEPIPPTLSSDDKPASVILDTDIGSSTDDLLALTALYRAFDARRIDLKAIMVNRAGAVNARLVDLMNTYYGHPEIPIGRVYDGVQDPDVFIDYWKMAIPEEYPDEPQNLPHTLTKEQLSGLPAAEKLYRKLLAEADDASVYVFSIGFATNIAHLLQSVPDEYSPLNGVDLVKRKVKALYIQGGHYMEKTEFDEPDYNFLQDPGNARILMDQWPVDMYFSPAETGDMFDYDPDVLLADFSKAGLTGSPVYHAYAHHFCSTGQRMWDVVTVLQWLYPEFFTLYGPVRYTIDDQMKLHEHSDADARHYMQYPSDTRSCELIMQFIRWYCTY